MQPRFLSVAVALAGIMGAAVIARAENVEVHGYGGWTYGRNDADGIHYLASSRDGEAGYVNLAIAVSSQASERVRVNAQVWWEAEPGEEGTTTVDYAFGEWRFADELRLRMGQVKHPYGIYTEVFDVGTIRPFFWLPQSVYGATGTVAESYRGIGLTGSHFAAGGWELEYDAYVGELDLEATDLLVAFGEATGEGGEGETEAIEEAGLRDLLGGRVTLTEPRSGLRFGLSAYRGRDDEEAGEIHRCLGLHVEHVTGNWSLRGEYAHLREVGALTYDATYLELARRLGGPWQVAGRVERASASLDGIDTDAAPGLLKHREATLGLNCWFHPDLVAKLAVSRVEGNRFAHPEDFVDAVADGTLPAHIHLLSLGVQFAF